MADWKVNASQLMALINSMNSGSRQVVRPAAKWVRKLTQFTESRMRRFATVKTSRSSGNLANSIRSQYQFNGTSLSGEVFVPERVKYQFAAEYGFSKRFTIQGKPLMSFPAENWKQARRAASVVRIGKRGVYIFARVKRGRYKGRRFVERAFNSLLAYYSQNEAAIIADIGQALFFAKG